MDTMESGGHAILFAVDIKRIDPGHPFLKRGAKGFKKESTDPPTSVVEMRLLEFGLDGSWNCRLLTCGGFPPVSVIALF